MLRSRLDPLARSLRRFARGLSWRSAADALPWCVGAIGLEVLGRTSRSDAIDALGVVLVWTGAGVLAARNAAGLRRLRPAIARALRGWRIELGLDLRGAPAVERRLPPRYVGLTLAAAGLVAGLFLARSLFPGAAAEALRAVSGLLWLTTLAVLWATLALGILLSVVFPAVFIEHKLCGPDATPLRHRGTVLAVVSAMIVATGLALRLLPAALLAPTFLVLAGVFAVLPAVAARGLDCLWRTPHGGRGPAACAAAWTAAAAAIGCALPFAALALLGTGDGLDGSPAPLTRSLTRAFGWSGAIAYATVFGMNAWTLVRNRLDDPARTRRPRVHLAGARAARAALGALRAAGLVPRRRGERAAVDVPLVVDPALPAGAFRSSFVWPRRVAPADLRDPALHALCHRRGEILARRALRRGLERILRGQMRRDFARGSGFWIAPHLWVAPHLTRDTDEEHGLPQLGPRYARVIPRRARHALHRLLCDVEIDLIFLEDGVAVPRFRRVLGLLFEFHDLFGRRPLEERHFQGIPGVRVLIHEHDFGEPTGLRLPGYAEPAYEDLSRARILHVFRDRGGDEEPATSLPADSGARGSPSAPRLVPSA